VILDDDADMGLLLPYLVRTIYDQGLTWQQAEQVIASLMP
jgi:hypothetical protein